MLIPLGTIKMMELVDVEAGLRSHSDPDRVYFGVKLSPTHVFIFISLFCHHLVDTLCDDCEARTQ